MLAISIRQPWASAIIYQGKDIENRTWAPDYHGPLLIHAAKGMTKGEYQAAMTWMAWKINDCQAMPEISILPRGGIIGIVTMVGCVSESDSKWFTGPYGFVLKDPRPLPFIPYTGQLGFFEVPDSLLPEQFRVAGAVK